MSLLLLGVFPVNPGLGYPPGAPATYSLLGAAHFVLGTLLFGQLSAVSFLLARRFATDAEWRCWSPGSMATGVIVAAFYVGTVVVASIDQGATGPAGWHGPLQRIAFFSGFAWLALVASRLSAISSSVSERARR